MLVLDFYCFNVFFLLLFLIVGNIGSKTKYYKRINGTRYLKLDIKNDELEKTNLIIKDEDEIYEYDEITIEDEILDYGNLERDPANIKTDKRYKMFYGEWIITKQIGANSAVAFQNINNMIGKKTIFTDWKSCFYYDGNNIEIDYPEYNIDIIPVEENSTCFFNISKMEELGIANNYIVIFTLEGRYADSMYYIIKDDETLILYCKGIYLEMKRTKYLSSHTNHYHPF